MEESTSICNPMADNKTGRPHSGSLICLSWVWLQTQIGWHNLLLAISQAKLWKKGKNWTKRLTKKAQTVKCYPEIKLQLWMWLFDLN